VADLTERDSELLRAMVSLMEAGVAASFDIGAGEDGLREAYWPDNVRPPNRNEVRALLARDLLLSDRSAPPGVWRFWPADTARAEFESEPAKRRADALRDPDARLGIILNAIVEAFEQDPSTPLLFVRAGQAAVVKHPNWPIEPDVVGMHDLRILEDLRLIGWDGSSFFPSPAGRLASHNPAGFLDGRAEEAANPEERSRLKGLAEKLRAGDIAVSTAGGLTGAALRALIGL
jgi:hypothetical protein